MPATLKKASIVSHFRSSRLQIEEVSLEMVVLGQALYKGDLLQAIRVEIAVEVDQ